MEYAGEYGVDCAPECPRRKDEERAVVNSSQLIFGTPNVSVGIFAIMRADPKGLGWRCAVYVRAPGLSR